MLEPTEDREGPHVAHTSRMRRGCRGVAGDALSATLMRPVLIEVGHVLPEHAPQMGLAAHHAVVQALPPDAAEEPLAGGVLPGGAIRRPQLRDAAASGMG
jgi:hypothetical protein